MLLSEIKKNPKNPRKISEHALKRLSASIERDPEFMRLRPIVIDDQGIILGGNMRFSAIEMLGMTEIPDEWVRRASDLTDEQKKRFILVDNAPAGMAGDWDVDILAEEWELPDLLELGFAVDAFDDLEIGGLTDELVEAAESRGVLAERFVVPPFSVLDTRSGVWQSRKDAWIGIGIESEKGRRTKLLFNHDTGRDMMFYQKKTKTEKVLGRRLTTKEYLEKYYQGGTGRTSGGLSIFDPVLCEITYRWFANVGGTVLDPFAGGSVRGVVASMLGRNYVGVDLREEQIDENEAQLKKIRSKRVEVYRQLELPSFDADRLPELTSVERRGRIWVKREDEFVIGGGRGGKVRTCWALAQGAAGLVTAGSRSSPQANIVAQIARKLNVPCRVHTPEGELSPELIMAQLAGAEVVQHKAGYNNVCVARAREDAKETGWREIPFGMECQEAVDATAAQVVNVPAEAKRIVIPVGSGMSLAGVLQGLRQHKRRIPVVGVVVGADPSARLDKYAPKGWREMVELVSSGMKYEENAKTTSYEGLGLDPIYESKCIPFLEPDDLLWVVGIRATAAPVEAAYSYGNVEWRVGDSRQIDKICGDVKADLIFSCHPYHDLEIYSDDPRDLSNMRPEEFNKIYREIIHKSCALLQEDRFAVFVVSEVRKKEDGGAFRGFVGETIKAFEAAGLRYYNDIVLINVAGSTQVRVGRQFDTGRKVGKVHQNVLVFVKGDPYRAAKACGNIELITEQEYINLFGVSDSEDGEEEGIIE